MRAGGVNQQTSPAFVKQRRGWSLGSLTEDQGYAAKDLKRPGICGALEALEKRDASGLVVAKLDRLSRSMLDFTALMATAQKQGWAIVALDCAVDTTTPAGEAMAHVMATFAHFERRLIGQRTKEALAVKRASGVRLGRPPEIPDAIAARIRDARISGATMRGIADTLTADGVPTARGGAWRPATVSRVLERARP
jgi:DNA invertase Pin-like site-specific DNA recombinase